MLSISLWRLTMCAPILFARDVKLPFTALFGKIKTIICHWHKGEGKEERQTYRLPLIENFSNVPRVQQQLQLKQGESEMMDHPQLRRAKKGTFWSRMGLPKSLQKSWRRSWDKAMIRGLNWTKVVFRFLTERKVGLWQLSETLAKRCVSSWNQRTYRKTNKCPIGCWGERIVKQKSCEHISYSWSALVTFISRELRIRCMNFSFWVYLRLFVPSLVVLDPKNI